MAASTYRHRTFAFVLRQALVLAAAGAAKCLLLASNAHTSHATLFERLIVVLVPVLGLGLVLFRPSGWHASPPASEDRAGIGYGLAGLVVLYLFLTCISRFMAYVGQQISMRGISVYDAILSVGAKNAAAAWLLAAAFLRPKRQPNKEIVVPGLMLLIAAIWIAFLSRTIVAFFAALLLLEITLDGFSARFQSAIVGAAPQFSGQWLNGAILLGAATGPPLYGLAIDAGYEVAFLVSTSLVTCLAIVWQRFGTAAKRT